MQDKSPKHCENYNAGSGEFQSISVCKVCLYSSQPDRSPFPVQSPLSWMDVKPWGVHISVSSSISWNFIHTRTVDLANTSLSSHIHVLVGLWKSWPGCCSYYCTHSPLKSRDIVLVGVPGHVPRGGSCLFLHFIPSPISLDHRDSFFSRRGLLFLRASLFYAMSVIQSNHKYYKHLPTDQGVKRCCFLLQKQEAST